MAIDGRLEPYREVLFPNLVAKGYRITSSTAAVYNCFAWAAGKNDRWWNPLEPDSPTHAARQLLSGKCTSKLGRWQDIEHELEGLVCELYGAVKLILRREVRS